MNDIYDVIKKPRVSEKATVLHEANGVLTLEVAVKATKTEIKQAVEKAFDVKVEAVNVVRKAPSNRERQGRVVGRKPGWKKAYVTLKKDSKPIKFFEGMAQ